MKKLQILRSAGTTALAASLGLLLILTAGLAGCATRSTVQTRAKDRADAFAKFTPEIQQLVKEGRIQVGMDTNAVYIAWGAPADVTSRGDQNGEFTTWTYIGNYMEETRYWTGRRSMRLVYDYQPRTFVRAEIVFSNGLVYSWRTLPQPPSS